ncbi:hypothetical protein SALWKB29_1147 [Snodgrassella communis]|uniref:Uncharacterized protein n=1 Tax=Snodgrassella communis TaxID=2946699 RepID=A0A836MPJ2_9NEIS|nr:hypothetical protein SALWKB29_1147 [Snodgrassella communis]
MIANQTLHSIKHKAVKLSDYTLLVPKKQLIKFDDHINIFLACINKHYE